MSLGEYVYVSHAGHCLAQYYMTVALWRDTRSTVWAPWANGLMEGYCTREGYSSYSPRVESLNQLLPFDNFLRFSKSRSIALLWYITFILDRYHRSTAAATPVEYEWDSVDLTDTFFRSWYVSADKSRNGTVTSTLVPLSMNRWDVFIGLANLYDQKFISPFNLTGDSQKKEFLQLEIT